MTLRRRLFSFLAWLLAYTISSLVSAATLLAIVFAFGSVGIEASIIESWDGEDVGSIAEAILLVWLSVSVIAFAPVALLLGVPELLGVRPVVPLWTLLGGAASLVSLIGLSFGVGAEPSLGSILRFFREPALSSTLVFFVAGLTGGFTLAVLRRTLLR